MKQKRVSAVTCLCVCLFTIPLVSQSQRDLPDLVSQSITIMRGRVTNLSAQWITDQNGKHIYSTAQLELIDTYKGIAPLSLTYIGGTVDTITEVVSDMFVLKPKDEAFFFLPAQVEKFYASKITVLSIKEGGIRREEGTISARNVEEAIRSMIKNPSLKKRFKDLSETEIGPGYTAPIPAGPVKLSKVTTLPNLKPYLFWNSSTYPIIVRNAPASSPLNSTETDSSPLNDNDSTTISFLVANYGSDAAGAFSVKIYVDAQLLWTENITGLAGGYYAGRLNCYVGAADKVVKS